MKHKVCILLLCLMSVLIGSCLSACEGTMTTTTTNEGQSLGDIVNNEDDVANGDWLVGETVDEFGDSEYTGIIRTPFRYYTDSVTVLSGFSSGIIRTAF